MNRYSLLYGTITHGTDTKWTDIAASAGIADFFQTELNASARAELVMDRTRAILEGFIKFSDYSSQPKDMPPVAVRYAPMHLSNQDKLFAGLKTFYALAVNGTQNELGDRGGIYTHIHFLSREAMYEGGDFNYLDQLFGTHLTTWQEVHEHKYGSEQINCNMPLQKIYPVNREQDILAVYAAVAAVYTGKNVIFRLDKDCTFNRRAFEILTEIYSLLQPKLAAETGFATYQDPESIRNLARNNSIRIFVIPAEARMEGIVYSEFVTFDLERAGKEENEFAAQFNKYLNTVDNNLKKAIGRWIGLPWEDREPLMRQLFADVADYQKPEIFIEKTNEFFSDGFHKWVRHPEERGSLENLEQLKGVYDRFPCLGLPYMQERFRKVAPTLMKKGIKIEDLTVQTLSDILLEQSRGERDTEKQEHLYQFGKTLSRGDLNVRTAMKVRESTTLFVTQMVTEKSAKELAAARAQTEAERASHAQEVAKMKADEDERMNSEKKAHEEELHKLCQNQIAELGRQKAAFDAIIAQKECTISEKEKTITEKESEIAAKEEEKRNALESFRAAAAKKLQEKEEENQAALEQKQSEYEATLYKKDQEAVELRSRFEGAYRKLQADSASALQAERGKTAMAEQQCAEGIARANRERDEAVAAVTQKLDIALSAKRSAEEGREAADRSRKKAEKDLADLKKELGHGTYSRKTIFTFAGVGFAVGAMLIGLIWLIISLVSPKTDIAPSEPNVPVEDLAVTIPTTGPSTEPIVSTVPDTEPPTEPATEPPTPMFDPNYQFTDWTSDETIEQLRLAIPEIAVVNVENNEDFCPEAFLEGCTVLAVFSVEHTMPVIDKTPPDDADTDGATEKTTEPSENNSDSAFSGKEEDEKTPSETLQKTKNYAVLLKTEDEVLEITEVPGASLVLRFGNHIVVAYGSDQMVTAAVKTLNLAAPGKEETPVLQVIWRVDEKTTIDLSDVSENMDWWRTAQSWTTCAVDLEADEQNDANKTPILTVDCTDETICVFDFRDEPEKIVEMIASILDGDASAVEIGGFIVSVK